MGGFHWRILCHHCVLCFGKSFFNKIYTTVLLSWIEVLFHTQLAYVMAGCRYFVCPVEFNNDLNSFQVDCEPSELFQLQDYALPSVLESITGWVSVEILGSFGHFKNRLRAV